MANFGGASGVAVFESFFGIELVCWTVDVQRAGMYVYGRVLKNITDVRSPDEPHCHG